MLLIGGGGPAVSIDGWVGDGSQDVLDPLPDRVRLAHALAHARLKLYPDAGHGFLVQHTSDWTRRVTAFLG